MTHAPSVPKWGTSMAHSQRIQSATYAQGFAQPPGRYPNATCAQHWGSSPSATCAQGCAQRPSSLTLGSYRLQPPHMPPPTVESTVKALTVYSTCATVQNSAIHNE
jgi:hypothetical protein